jgi:cytochrome c nitrite reductase small subunit
VTFPAGSDGANKFLQWKREQTAKAVDRISRDVRAVRPHLPITSYVVGPAEMDNKAQSWDLWASRGLVDAVAVSMYGADISEAASYLSDDPEACINCHIMIPQYATWRHSSHGRDTVCNDCHVPQDSVFAKYYFKAKDGLRHSAIHGYEQAGITRQLAQQQTAQPAQRASGHHARSRLVPAAPAGEHRTTRLSR